MKLNGNRSLDYTSGREHQKELETARQAWETPNVKTLTADNAKRVRIPNAKPRQVFAYTNNGDGSITLTPVKTERRPAFPRGSLTKYFTGALGRERDKLEIALARGCVQGPE
jgi:hypothetical protein